MKMKITRIVPIVALIMVSLACNMGPIGGGTDATAEPGATQPPLEIQPPAGAPDPQPVDINEGLASLDYAQMTIRYILSQGGGDSSDMTFEVLRTANPEARLTRITTTTTELGSETETDTTEIYRIGNDQCSGSAEEWSWESLQPNEAEMLDIVQDMVGITPLVDNPTFVGQETVNGVATNHFFFTVSGLGVESGAEVTINQVHYWLAVDGQYIVKYDMVTETRMSPDAGIMHQEFHIDLHSINQPFSISFPQGCLDASLVTPEP